MLMVDCLYDVLVTLSSLQGFHFVVPSHVLMIVVAPSLGLIVLIYGLNQTIAIHPCH
jgi:hypothetical protein